MWELASEYPHLESFGSLGGGVKNAPTVESELVAEGIT